MKRTLLSTILAAMLFCFALPVIADNTGLTYHEIQVYDELGRKVTGISSVYIYNPGTTTNATIYKGPNKTLAITLPMTTTSTNTTLVDGYFSWWGGDQYDFTISDGTDTFTSGGRSLDGTIGKLMFPLFLKDVSSTAYSDSETITLGTDSDWVISGGATANLLKFTPAADASTFRIGLADGTKSANFQVYTASGVGLLIDESGNTFGITGLTTSINASSNYVTNINTGTSTGAVNIGSATAGTVAIDTTSNFTANADDLAAISVTDGAITLTAAGATNGDMTLTVGDDFAVAATGNVAIDGALMSIDAAGVSNITNTSGTTADDFTIALAGATNSSLILSSTGTAADAFQIITTAGGIDITNGGAAAGEDIDVTSTSASINLTAGESATDSINIVSSIGGINIFAAGGAATEDINIAAISSSITIVAGENDAGAILLKENGGTSGAIKLHADTGTGAASLYLLSDLGGITATATAGPIAITAGTSTTVTSPQINLAGQINLGTVSTFTDSDATPDVTGKTYWNSNTTTYTITDFDGAGLASGQMLIITSKGAITFDVTSSGLKGGSTDIVTAAGDVTTWIYDGTDWLLISFMDMSDNMNTGA